jgi:hypothetical protein
VCFFYAAQLTAMAYSLMGINAVITWLKLFKYLNLFPHLTMFSITLRNACFPIISFSCMFTIVFCSCAQAFLMAFGPNLRNFSTFLRALMTLFRALLGDFDYVCAADTRCRCIALSGRRFVLRSAADSVRPLPQESLEEGGARRWVAALLFTTFIFLCFFVLMNMFIAILTESYEKAKVEVFGDAQHEREDEWVGAIPFVHYIKRVGGYALSLLPGLGGQKKKRVYAESHDTAVDGCDGCASWSFEKYLVPPPRHDDHVQSSGLLADIYLHFAMC